jgi:hypothetical protein
MGDMAERMKAKAYAVDHTPSVTAPSAVVDVIRDAIRPGRPAQPLHAITRELLDLLKITFVIAPSRL